jgi:DNA ligase-associated metallophosphoesterase
MTDVAITLRGEALLLLPERAVYWPARETLIIADPHFGKAAAFRAGGIPIPGGTTAAMTRRLDAALGRSGATRLLVLGDLLHARDGRAPRLLEEVTRWREERPDLRVVLVRGNHDRRAGDPPAEWRVECRDAPVIEPPFVWRHEPPVAQAGRLAPAPQPGQVEPQESPDRDPALGAYPIAGHVHPAAALGGNGRSLTLPCFYFGRDYALLPAFGEFTGTAIVRPRAGERVFVLAGETIVEK